MTTKMRWYGLPCLGALLAVALAACGGSGHASHRTLIRKSHASALPARASSDIHFASDSGVSGSVPSAHVAGRLIAWSRFEPGINGFSFQNYGFIAGADLDQQSMRELFGNAVCATAPSNSCTLTPAAQQWLTQAEQSMTGGHCFGFSMTALRFFTHNLSPSAFGASTTYALSLTPALQAQIGEDFITQESSVVQDAEMPMTPSAAVSFLTRTLADQGGPQYTLGIRDATTHDGHAITPIGIESLGGDRYQILIYDNNKPDTVQAVEVNTQAETWSYLVATNPSQPNAVWSGQGTNNEMFLIPVSASEKREPCPFCSGSGAAPTDTISLGGDPVAHAHLLITTADGRKLGYVGNRLVDQIPGARVILPEANAIWRTSPEPLYQVPAGQKLTVTVQGGDPTGTETAELHITGPGFGTTVANLVPTTSSRTQVTLTPGAGAVSVRIMGTAPQETPTLQLARDHGRTGKLVTLTPTRTLSSGTALSVGLQPANHRVSVTSSKSQPVTVTLNSVGPTGTKTVHSSGVGVSAGHQTTLTLGLIKVG